MKGNILDRCIPTGSNDIIIELIFPFTYIFPHIVIVRNVIHMLANKRLILISQLNTAIRTLSAYGLFFTIGFDIRYARLNTGS